MSINSWKGEFLQGDITEAAKTELGAVEHSLRKWKGLREKNMAAHGVWIHNKRVCDNDGNSGFWEQIPNDFTTCALCQRYTNRETFSVECDRCPLYKVTGGSCDYDGPYREWIDTGNPKPMIKALKKIRKVVKAKHSPKPKKNVFIMVSVSDSDHANMPVPPMHDKVDVLYPEGRGGPDRAIKELLDTLRHKDSVIVATAYADIINFVGAAVEAGLLTGGVFLYYDDSSYTYHTFNDNGVLQDWPIGILVPDTDHAIDELTKIVHSHNLPVSNLQQTEPRQCTIFPTAP